MGHPGAAGAGRPRVHPYRQLVNAILYVLRGGCAWRLLPREFPPWKTVYHYVRQWRLDGTWERIYARLRERLRVLRGRHPQPSAGIIDSQSVKTTSVGGPRGFDAGKKITGRKRHLLVDTEGLVLERKVHPADIMDRDGVKLLVPPGATARHHLERLRHVWVDSGYNGRDKGKDWLEHTFGWTVAVVRHPPKPRYVWAPEGAVIDWAALLPPPGFRVLPRRWVVERTLAWLGHNRRLSKDYERCPETSEAWIDIGMSRVMLRRLAR